MWDRLRQTDIERAKQELRLRRIEILHRHSQELHNLSADQADLETLNQLVNVFAKKFLQSKMISPEPIATAVGNGNMADKRPSEARHPPQGNRAQTNFDTLDRKSTRLNSSHIQKSRMPSSA